MRRLRLLCCAALALVGTALLVAPPAGAESAARIADDGWWWRAQTGLLTELPPPPGVEEGQLLVQSGPDGAQAIAAVSAVLAEGETNPVLTLDVATDGGGAAAVVLACQAGSAWVGDDAGRWDSKPQVDCSTSVTGIPSDDGSQWTFALGPLQFGDRFNVVLVPGVLADSDAYPSFHLAFEAPTAASIATTAGATPAPPIPPPTAPPAPAASPATGSAAETASTPLRSGAIIPPTTAPTTVVPAQPALDAQDQGRSASAPIAQQAAAAVVPPAESRTVARVVGLLVLLAGVAGVVSTRRVAGAGAEASPEAPVLGGLARFRSERVREPNPVS